MSQELQSILGIIGGIAGLISIGGVIYTLGFRIGKIDTAIRSIEEKLIDQKEFGELTSKVQTLYKIYVEGALSSPRGSNPGHNPGGNPEATNVIPALPSVMVDVIHSTARENPEKDVADIVSLALDEIAGAMPDVLISYLRESRESDIPRRRIIEAMIEEAEKARQQ